MTLRHRLAHSSRISENEYSSRNLFDNQKWNKVRAPGRRNLLEGYKKHRWIEEYENIDCSNRKHQVRAQDIIRSFKEQNVLLKEQRGDQIWMKQCVKEYEEDSLLFTSVATAVCHKIKLFDEERKRQKERTIKRLMNVTSAFDDGLKRGLQNRQATLRTSDTGLLSKDLYAKVFSWEKRDPSVNRPSLQYPFDKLLVSSGCGKNKKPKAKKKGGKKGKKKK